jgi:hypothetical protein
LAYRFLLPLLLHCSRRTVRHMHLPGSSCCCCFLLLLLLLLAYMAAAAAASLL